MSFDYQSVKKRAIERFFAKTNDKQKEAIFRIDGPVLIIAGAGSGKTTVLCNRIANMLLFGDAYNSGFTPDLSAEDEAFLLDYADGRLDNTPENVERLSDILSVRRVYPWKILAVTFTNKAAAELKERLEKMNAPAGEVWASTFHSACVKILRRCIDVLGYTKSFTIYDTDDSLRVIKDSMKMLGISDKSFSPKDIQGRISRAKDKLITPADFEIYDSRGRKDYLLSSTQAVYAEYQKRLKNANALDFDDIIMLTVQIFQKYPEILSQWQNKFEYIMVDEYQDTNHAQYMLVTLLAGGSGNLCVVGDEDQSIYRFRGATIENILSFEKEYNGTVIKLEQNYRSTSTILEAANAVISNNTQHKDKHLWSDMGEGEKITISRFNDEQAEAMFVANTILENVKDGGSYSDHTLLYRTNAQSRTFELAFNRMAVPYRVIGGTKFYDRKEIKDIIAYLSVINNPYDTVRLKRIINEPKRGIGDVTQAEIEETSAVLGISPIEVMERADEFAALTKKAKTLIPFGNVFRELIDTADGRDMTAILDDVMTMTGYQEMLLTQGDEGQGRLENIKELKSAMITFAEENEGASLSDFLEQVALISDLDNYQEDDDKVTMMTMHSAKGLEFDTVFLVGAEDGIFPSIRSIGDIFDLEEERRLAYVAITRAKKKLYATTAASRLMYGQTMHNRASRFLAEIPPECVEYRDETRIASLSGFAERKSAPKPNYLREHSYTPEKPVVSNETFSAGDRITHRIFGNGTVISATPAGNDTLVEIAFDKVGTKKIMANFAKVKKI